MPRCFPAQVGCLLLACTLIGLPSTGATQTLDAPPPLPDTSMPCPPQQVPASSDPLVRSLTIEWALLKQDWCKLMRWDDTWSRLQYLLVDLFTGPGLHPTAGIVVPDGGAAGGLALNVDWNTTTPIYQRFSTSVEGRATENGFWEVGARLQTLLAGYSERGKSPQVTLFASHLDLPRLPYYGLGNGSPEDGRKLYGLRDSAVAMSLDVPVPAGFALGGEIAGLWFAPEVSTSFGSVFNEETAPGLHTKTAYVRPRASVSWSYPDRGVLYGLSSSAVVSYGFYGAVAGGDFSFSRVEARWNVGLGLDPRFGSFRFASRVIVNDPRSHNRVPFYLQPTIGGADINDENVLRGYHNYRFRDPNLVAYELNYERQIFDPLGIRLFGQYGKVGTHASDLGFGGLKSSVGASLTFRLGGAAVAELSFGWSHAEGVHVYATGNTNNLGGLTAGLRGVF
jgi:hypothetical protein